MTLFTLVAVLATAVAGAIACVGYAVGIVLWLFRDARRRARADVRRAAECRVWSVHRGDRVGQWRFLP